MNDGLLILYFFFFQAEDGIRDDLVTGVQTCALPISEFARLLGEVEAARLILTSDGRGVYLAARETTLFARLIEGRFPEIDRVIPQDWRTRVTEIGRASCRERVEIPGEGG